VDHNSLLQSHEIELLRRSFAIGNGLPNEQIRRLIETCDALSEHARQAQGAQQSTRPDVAQQLRRELDSLRPIVAELRTRLTGLQKLADAHIAETQ
jgi:DNA-binding transcriptional MerR regulator